jgi:hypothetical protein
MILSINPTGGHYKGIIFPKIARDAEIKPFSDLTSCVVYDSMGPKITHGQPKITVHQVTDNEIQMNKHRRLKLATYVKI